MTCRYSKQREADQVRRELEEGIEEHGPAFEAWYEHTGLVDVDRFDDEYRGEWASREEYARDWAENCQDLPREWEDYIDWHAYAEGLFQGEHYDLPAGDYNIYVFWSY